MKKKPKVVAIIQARMGSTRLPGKVMLPLAGKPLLWHVIERTKKIKGIDEIVLATSTKKRDDVLVALANKSRIKVFRGSESDVLERFIGAADAAKADIVLRICSDVALLDIETATAIIRELIKKNADVVFVHGKRPSAVGGFEVVTLDTLKRVKDVTNKPFDEFAHEHVTVYLGLNPKYYLQNKDFAKRILFAPPAKFATNKMHVAVDYPDDYAFMQDMYTRFYKSGHIVPLAKVVAFLRSHRES